jgi:hypothetical protein
MRDDWFVPEITGFFDALVRASPKKAHFLVPRERPLFYLLSVFLVPLLPMLPVTQLAHASCSSDISIYI